MTSPSRRLVSVAVVVMHRGMMLLVQRKDGNIPRNSWEFPNGPLLQPEPLDDAAVSILLSSVNIAATKVERVGIFDNPTVISDLVIVYGARMDHHGNPSVGSPDIVRVTWAQPSKLPPMAPGHHDLMQLYLASRFR